MLFLALLLACVLACRASHSSLVDLNYPIWHDGDGARYVFFQKQVNVSDKVASAIARITASQSNSDEKLLGSYKLYIGSVDLVAIGPGRGEARTGAYSDGGGVENHTLYDTLELTEQIKHRSERPWKLHRRRCLLPRNWTSFFGRIASRYYIDIFKWTCSDHPNVG